jgi:hypothetical protein
MSLIEGKFADHRHYESTRSPTGRARVEFWPMLFGTPLRDRDDGDGGPGTIGTACDPARLPRQSDLMTSPHRQRRWRSS